MQYLLVLILGAGLGGLIEYGLGFLLEFLERKPVRINHKFTISKKISLASLPIWGVLAMLFIKGSLPYFMLFLASAFVGTLFEGALGLFMKIFFGVKLWTYKHGAIGNFTSWYSIPYWGGAGLLFVVVGKIVGL